MGVLQRVLASTMYSIAGNFHQEKIFPFSPPAMIGENSYPRIFFISCVNVCIEDMATFTVLMKINSAKCFRNTKVA